MQDEELKILERSMHIVCARPGYIHAGLGGYDEEGDMVSQVASKQNKGKVEHALEEWEESQYEYDKEMTHGSFPLFCKWFTLWFKDSLCKMLHIKNEKNNPSCHREKW